MSQSAGETSTYFLTILLFRRVFAISAATLVLFPFTAFDILSTIDLLNEARQVPRHTNTHAVRLSRDSTLFLRVHVHVRLLRYSYAIFWIPDIQSQPQLTRSPPRGARRTGWCCGLAYPAQSTHGYGTPVGKARYSGSKN